MFDTTDGRPTKPETFKFCSCCNEYVLRSQWLDHEHHHRKATGERFYADHDGSNLMEDVPTDESDDLNLGGF